MLLTILQSCADSDPDGQCHAQRELAELLHISPAAVANSLKSLEKGGYIRRERGRDARRNRVLLTPKGQQAVIGCQMAFETVSRGCSRASPRWSGSSCSPSAGECSITCGGSPHKTQAKEEP